MTNHAQLEFMGSTKTGIIIWTYRMFQSSTDDVEKAIQVLYCYLYLFFI